MLGQCRASVFLAWRDWKFEWLLSLCAILALASMLTPILVLQGLKNGLVQNMRERLLRDPAVLVITPKSDAGRFSPDFIKELASLPGAAFAIGRTRDTATDISLGKPGTNIRASIALEPAGPGEPVLKRYGLEAPENAAEPEIVLAEPAARLLKVNKGDALEARIGRRSPEGKLESGRIIFRVSGILPALAADRKMAFVSLRLLEDLENYRDYLEVPERGFSGYPHSGYREYASFRLYAANLDAVEGLAAFLAGRNIEVIAKSREIAAIRALAKAIGQVVLIISMAVGAGFCAFTLSSVQSSVSRKKRMLGMLRLLGFRRLPLMLYPMAQTLLTTACGFILSMFFYSGVSLGIAKVFSGQGEVFCVLGSGDMFLAGLSAGMLSLLSCLRAAFAAASVEPSMVIREV